MLARPCHTRPGSDIPDKTTLSSASPNVTSTTAQTPLLPAISATPTLDNLSNCTTLNHINLSPSLKMKPIASSGHSNTTRGQTAIRPDIALESVKIRLINAGVAHPPSSVSFGEVTTRGIGTPIAVVPFHAGRNMNAALTRTPEIIGVVTRRR